MSAPATFVKSRRKRYAACGDVSNDYKKDIFAISAGDSERSRS